MATIPTLVEVKQYMRVDPDYILEDDLIEQMIRAAVDWCEQYTGLAFTQRQFIHYSSKHSFDLEFYPLASIESITDSTNAEVTYSQGTGIYPKIYPSYAGVTVNYTAGYTDDLPDNLKLAVMMFVNTIYENREDFVISNFRTFANTLPISVKELLGLHTRSAGLFL